MTQFIAPVLADAEEELERSLRPRTLDDFVVECPWHGSRFDVRTGQVVGPPARTPIRSYPVAVEGGKIWVDLPRTALLVKDAEPVEGVHDPVDDGRSIDCESVFTEILLECRESVPEHRARLRETNPWSAPRAVHPQRLAEIDEPHVAVME